MIVLYSSQKKLANSASRFKTYDSHKYNDDAVSRKKIEARQPFSGVRQDGDKIPTPTTHFYPLPSTSKFARDREEREGERYLFVAIKKGRIHGTN